jgi:hypothetical protein
MIGCYIFVKMKIKRLFSKIPLWIFCIVMIIFFYAGLAYPIQTDYWLVKNGIIIMILEFISIFSTIILLSASSAEAEKKLGVQVSGLLAEKLPRKVNYWIIFVVIMIMALFFTSFYNIWLFFYFLVSNGIKFFGFKQMKITKQINDSVRAFGVTIISLILSAIIGFISSFFIGIFFHDQLDLLYDYQKSIFSGFAAIEVFAMWGILYFALLIFFDWYADYWETKTGKPFVRTYK